MQVPTYGEILTFLIRSSTAPAVRLPELLVSRPITPSTEPSASVESLSLVETGERGKSESGKQFESFSSGAANAPADEGKGEEKQEKYLYLASHIDGAAVELPSSYSLSISYFAPDSSALVIV